ncbi:hypothetical protein AM1_5323 [Acaryochloris marina MBIC11017]|uniref:Uncharacterized protein n=1 Tax=Acaryochloris marina (strain MBIC 11017) TaxID=329726 RepID=B0CAT0_ACAM1|nr:hypothetical protein AM1_5323 [Acaryochloris marina MBIC11017]
MLKTKLYLQIMGTLGLVIDLLTPGVLNASKSFSQLAALFTVP